MDFVCSCRWLGGSVACFWFVGWFDDKFGGFLGVLAFCGVGVIYGGWLGFGCVD